MNLRNPGSESRRLAWDGVRDPFDEPEEVEAPKDQERIDVCPESHLEIKPGKACVCGFERRAEG